MPIDSYTHSTFYSSSYMGSNLIDAKHAINKKMDKLTKSGVLGNITARVFSPFVGLGTYLLSICLRIGTILEAFIGFFVDIGAAICFKNTTPLKHTPIRCEHIFRNLIDFVGGSITDIYYVAFCIGIKGIFVPKDAYPTNLDPFKFFKSYEAYDTPQN